ETLAFRFRQLKSELDEALQALFVSGLDGKERAGRFVELASNRDAVAGKNVEQLVLVGAEFLFEMADEPLEAMHVGRIEKLANEGERFRCDEKLMLFDRLQESAWVLDLGHHVSRRGNEPQ